MLPPRTPLAELPTPLMELPRFGAAIGARVLCKRDDVGGPGTAGNKVRKLERLLGLVGPDAAVVTIGAAQSNHARATAAACARLGRRCVLVLGGDEPAGPPAGNHLLDVLFGAELAWAGSTAWDDLAARAELEAQRLRDAGEEVLVLPAGGSLPAGAVAFADAYAELVAQLDEPVGEIVHASTTGGTHGGLVAGRVLGGGVRPAVRGVVVIEDPHDGLADLYAWLAREAVALLGGTSDVHRNDLLLEYGFLGDGYGAPTPEGVDAIRLLARTEGIVCDPVYTGKALACLVERARAGAYADDAVVFWHTGGWPAVLTPSGGQILH